MKWLHVGKRVIDSYNMFRIETAKTWTEATHVCLTEEEESPHFLRDWRKKGDLAQPSGKIIFGHIEVQDNYALSDSVDASVDASLGLFFVKWNRHLSDKKRTEIAQQITDLVPAIVYMTDFEALCVDQKRLTRGMLDDILYDKRGESWEEAGAYVTLSRIEKKFRKI